MRFLHMRNHWCTMRALSVCHWVEKMCRKSSRVRRPGAARKGCEGGFFFDEIEQLEELFVKVASQPRAQRECCPWLWRGGRT